MWVNEFISGLIYLEFDYLFIYFFSVVLIVSSFNNTEDNSEDSETEENLVKSSDDPTTKSEKRPTDNNSKNSETIKKEIVVLPWIDLTKLSVVTKNWEKIDLATADQDQIIREKLLLNSTASCFSEKNSSNCSGASAAAAEPEVVVNWLKKHQLSVEFQNKIISIQGGLVKLKYPYTANECQSTNLIVLDRVTSILAQMPSTV